MSDSDDRLDQLDYYTLLGVARDASADDIKRAFRTFARRFHPDRFVGAPEEKVARATRIYRRGSEAVQTLADLEGRRAYDLALSRGELRLKSDARAARAAPARPHAPRTQEYGAVSASPRVAPGAGHPRVASPATAPGIRSPSARAFFARAQEASRAGDLKAAHRHVKSAMEQEPGNPLLEHALSKIERAIRGW